MPPTGYRVFIPALLPQVSWALGRRDGSCQILGRSRVSETPEIAPEVRLLRVIESERTRQELQQALGLKDDERFRKTHLQPALTAGLIEMTIPDKPRSSRQKHRLTAEGRKRAKGGN